MKKNYNKNANDYMCSMTLGDLQSKRQSFQFISRDTYAAYDILAANDYMNIVLFASYSSVLRHFEKSAFISGRYFSTAAGSCMGLREGF